MKRPRLAIVLIAIAVVLTGLGWYFYYGPPARERSKPSPPTQILASGFIETTDVDITPEVTGRIVSISAAEGDSVRAGDALVKLDDSLLLAQQRQAEAAVTVAKLNLQQGVITRDGAKKALDNALDVVNNPLTLDRQIIAAQADLDVAELNLQHAQQLPTNYWDLTALVVRRDTARKVLDNLNAIKSNPQDANASVDRARTAYDAAAAAVDVLNAQVAQAQAPLDVIKVQLTRTTLLSPVTGVVRARRAEVGEVAQTGVPVLTVTQPAVVTLTVYVPESEIGLVKLGQETRVSVDSYPGEIFGGKVTLISPQAEFTPRNVQIKEERTKTVYAVKIALSNPQLKLKAGMPADAAILVGPM